MTFQEYEHTYPVLTVKINVEPGFGMVGGGSGQERG